MVSATVDSFASVLLVFDRLLSLTLMVFTEWLLSCFVYSVQTLKWENRLRFTKEFLLCSACCILTTSNCCGVLFGFWFSSVRIQIPALRFVCGGASSNSCTFSKGELKILKSTINCIFLHWLLVMKTRRCYNRMNHHILVVVEREKFCDLYAGKISSNQEYLKYDIGF